MNSLLVKRNNTFWWKITTLAALFLVIFSLVPSMFPVNAQEVEDDPCSTSLNPLNTLDCVKQTVNDFKQGGAEVVTHGLVAGTTGLLAAVSSIVFSLMIVILGLAGVMFNLSIDYSIVRMGQWVNSEAVMSTWMMFRDVVNMFLIFILLYVSIGTILSLSGFNAKKTVTYVIIVALFINFSLFATRLVVDVSNVLAVSMYNNIVNSEVVNRDLSDVNEFNVSEDSGNEEVANELKKSVLESKGLSAAIMRPLLLVTFFNPENTENVTFWNAIFGGELKEGLEEGSLNNPRILTASVMGSVMMLITAFVFLSASLMFIFRIAILIFLMIVSPVALGSIALPKAKWGSQWLDTLLKNAFFAPIYMFLVYIVVYFINTADFIEQSEPVSIFINFFIAIVLMLTALVVAHKFGVAGAKQAREWGAKGTFALAGWTGRRTLGRAGYRLAESRMVKGMVKSDSALSRKTGLVLKGAGDYTAKSSFDFRKAPVAGEAVGEQVGGFGKVNKIAAKGHKGTLDQEEKQLKDTAKWLGRKSVGEKKEEMKLKDTKGEHEKEMERLSREKDEFYENNSDIQLIREDLSSIEENMKEREEDLKDEISAIRSDPSFTPSEKDKKIEEVKERFEKELADMSSQIDSKKNEIDKVFNKSELAANIARHDKAIKEADKGIKDIKDATDERKKEFGESIKKKTLMSSIMGTSRTRKEVGSKITSGDFDEEQKSEKDLNKIIKEFKKKMEDGDDKGNSEDGSGGGGDKSK